MRANRLGSSLPFFATAFFSLSSADVNSFDSLVDEAVDVDVDDDGAGARKGREVVKRRTPKGVARAAAREAFIAFVLHSRGANLAWTNGETGAVEVRQVDEASRNHAGAEIGGGRAMVDGGVQDWLSSALV